MIVVELGMVRVEGFHGYSTVRAWYCPVHLPILAFDLALIQRCG